MRETLDERPICPSCNGVGVLYDGYMGGWDCPDCETLSRSYRRRTKAEMEELQKSLSPLDRDMLKISGKI